MLPCSHGANLTNNPVPLSRHDKQPRPLCHKLLSGPGPTIEHGFVTCGIGGQHAKAARRHQRRARLRRAHVRLREVGDRGRRSHAPPRDNLGGRPALPHRREHAHARPRSLGVRHGNHVLGHRAQAPRKAPPLLGARALVRPHAQPVPSRFLRTFGQPYMPASRCASSSSVTSR